MSRPLVLLFGATLWLSFGVIVLMHVLSGDWMGPVASVVVGAMVFAVYLARRRVSATA